MQGAGDGEPAHARQAVRRPAQGLLQQAQRPGGGAVGLALGGSSPLGQDALLLRGAIADARPAAMVWVHGGQPLAVEAADPGGNGLIVAAPDQTSRGSVAGAISDRQQSTGAVDLSSGALWDRLRRVSSVRSSAVSGRRDLSGDVTWHTSQHEDQHVTIPNPTADDPLVGLSFHTASHEGGMVKRFDQGITETLPLRADARV